jgi:hypothetical protein
MGNKKGWWYTSEATHLAYINTKYIYFLQFNQKVKDIYEKYKEEYYLMTNITQGYYEIYKSTFRFFPIYLLKEYIMKVEVKHEKKNND